MNVVVGWWQVRVVVEGEGRVYMMSPAVSIGNALGTVVAVPLAQVVQRLLDCSCSSILIAVVTAY